jgi:DNA-binding NarL/FixJ family response regulator
LNKLKLVIAEDHEQMRCGLIKWLSARFEIVGAVKDGVYLVDAAISLHPDVIVSDILMPRLTGPQALKELAIKGYCIPFVFVSSETQLLREGAWSLVDKMDIPLELEKAIDTAALGKPYISSRALWLKSLEPYRTWHEV